MAQEYVLRPFATSTRLRIDYERELNPQQREAVMSPPGPALVIAGAGSGKTRTLTYRVAFLLEQGVPPDRILLLTFTNKAAREMLQRVETLLGRLPGSLWGGTFHAIGHRILRLHAERLGYPANFGILDREDARHLLNTCLRDKVPEARRKHFPRAEVLAEIFSLAANLRLSLAEVVGRYFDYFEPLLNTITEVHRLYEERKRAAQVMDFDDLLVRWLELLEQHPDAREYWQRRFLFLLVDEYQDTNVVQSAVVDLLAARHHNLMVVGDDAQSIYGWRGADARNILEFPNRYPEARVFKIETNYRSTPEILQVANAVIRANRHQFPKVLVAVRPAGPRPAVVACLDDSQQAAFVAQRVMELREAGTSLDRIAVLYRAHHHALELQMELTRRQIPFTITSGLRFLEQAHMKDVTAHLRLVVNPLDSVAFQRVVQMLPGIGERGAARLWESFRTQWLARQTGLQAGAVPAAGASVSACLRACQREVGRKAAAAWEELARLVTKLEDPELRRRPGQMIRTVLQEGYEEYLKLNYPNYRSRREDLEQLALYADGFDDVYDFLAQTALLTNVEAEDEQPGGWKPDRLRLSTVHQAKGLEFDVVFVIMLCEGMFPSARALEEEEGEEEERRLFYVAVTRARNELYLTYPLLHRARSADAAPVQTPSRFLREIPAELVETWELRPPVW
ncbi:ATP-dependent helicase [Limisphaera ngatamarikiensis]|uniref:DNA 3'-5' helicase n=1 Tax=Limisphaera ngatamarikiensis TaxID=1324935 RepID=A0A6M1RWA9_9BACT|nr:ATP-dependent helicase [Limisphaera ngatamarikiensis]NGO39701.1 ATP-dependent helicase [Limisphaera ngatamarikiensis]